VMLACERHAVAIGLLMTVAIYVILLGSQDVKSPMVNVSCYLG
jgi:hypothetical protein